MFTTSEENFEEIENEIENIFEWKKKTYSIQKKDGQIVIKSDVRNKEQFNELKS